MLLNIPAIMALMIPLIIFMIPIVAILTAHQRRMAELIHGNRNSGPEMAVVQEELRQLRDQVAKLTLALDDRTRVSVEPPGGVRARLGEPK